MIWLASFTVSITLRENNTGILAGTQEGREEQTSAGEHKWLYSGGMKAMRFGE